MNFPYVHECCCCNNECCGSGTTMNTFHSTNSARFCQNNANNVALKEYENIASHTSLLSKRKRHNNVSLFTSFRNVTQRQCVNLVCIFSVILLSFVNVGNTSEIPINTSNFLNGESTPESLPPFGNPADAPSIPTASSSSASNVAVPGPPPSSPSVQQASGISPSTSVTTQSYFINGYANQIQRTNVTDLRALAKTKPIQLQFRTVCPFGNIINDDKFALRFNSAGYLTYLELPQESQQLLSRNTVADGRWHSVTFSGSHVFLDDPDDDGRYGTSIIWDSSSDEETDNHKLFFFDGFVGCIRLQFQPNNTLHSNGIDNVQSSTNAADQDPLVLFKGLQKYQPCNDLQFDLGSSAQCFQPDSFVLCSKCEHNATCVFTDGKNECQCPETEDVRYTSPFCTKEETVDMSVHDIPESREFHPGFDDPENPFSSSTTGSSRSSFQAQSSPLMSSTTEHMAASSSIEQSRVTLESECSCVRGKCINEGHTWSCDCAGTGYRGRRCNNDVCDENPTVCGTHGKCFDDPESELGFECYCKPGYAGELCDINFNECLSNPCVNNGTCQDGINTYSCVCQAGYKGKNCEIEINECDSNPCENESNCTDLIADYNCECLPGFTGKNCEVNIDECESAPCLNGGNCVDGINSYECNCDNTGFNGDHCENNIDDCESSPCMHGGNCTDGINAYNCSCYPGYEGHDCQHDIPDCELLPCKNDGTCYERSKPELWSHALGYLEFDYSTAAGYVCECRDGYEGKNCETDIDECQRTDNPCNGHGKCIDGIAEYSCKCDKGFEGNICEIDINECEPNPCLEANECKNLAGDYQCECNAGYGGKNCTVALTGCITNVCFNEGSCTPVYDEATDSHSFQCSCKSGFTGDTCNIKTTMAFNGSSLAEIVKNDDAFANNKYNLNFWFRTTLPDVVLAVGQGGTYFYLGLSGGKLNLQSSLINNLQGMSSGNNLHDGKWHSVVVSINSSHAILSADIEQVTLPIAEVEDIPQQPTGFNLTILGGLKSSLGFLNKHDLNPFVGCMQDVKINYDRILPEEAENVNLTNIVSQCVRKDQCNPNPCANGGTCTDLWQKFTCNCPRPHLGGRCQFSYIAATFNHEDSPNSLAVVDIPPGRFGGVFDISMFVRTRDPRGTIFLLCDKERGLNGSYIEATITKSGNLVVQAKWTGSAEGGDESNSKPEPYTVDGLLSDGNPHLISVQRDRSFVVIKVDDSEHFRKSHSNRIFSPTVMYIGGKPAQLTGQETPVIAPVPEGHSGETSTSFPDGSIDNNTEGTAADTEGTTEVLVPESYRFKGTIQDVRINLSAPDTGPSIGHTSHSKAQSVYIVEFFNLTEIHNVKHPLGRVTTQNLREGTVSDDHCKNNPCYRGTCSVTWNDFKCECYEEYDGKHCDVRLRCADVACPDRSACKNIGNTGFECVADAAFDGKGHTTPHYVLRSSVSTADLTFNELSFRYRSKRPGNVVHISNGSSSLRVSLDSYEDESAVRFHFAHNVIIALMNSTILDGEWHSISIKFSSPDNPVDNAVILSYDKMEVPQNNFTLAHSHQYLRDLILSPNSEIVVGSSLATSSDPGHSHNQYYRGCLRDVYIGSYRLPFISPSKLEEVNPKITNRSFIEETAPVAFYINEVLHHSEQQLPRLGCILCYEKDCKNAGHCTDPTQSYDCTCAPGYEGETCDRDIDECIDNRCSHGSTCIDIVNNYTCSCAKGYEGWLCNINIDECDGNGDEKCNYNGQCEDGIGEYKCICNDDYTGTHCDKPKKSSCRDKPCENGATCNEVGMQSNGVSFKCTCAQGWEGEFCSERIDYCKDAQCENGDCENTLFGYKCNCIVGFAGIHCEVNIDECTPNPCKNDGKCIDGVNAFSCNCTDTGFTGATCEEDIDECNEWSSWSQICKEPLICENFIGSYQCSCPNKLKCGDTCEVPNPCYDGQNVTCNNGGTCKAMCDDPDNPEAVCLCLPGFNGAYCETLQYAQPAGESGVDILLIIIPVLAAILIAATVGIIILVRMARRKRATRGVYSPSQQEYCNPRVELDNVMKPPPEERLI